MCMLVHVYLPHLSNLNSCPTTIITREQQTSANYEKHNGKHVLMNAKDN